MTTPFNRHKSSDLAHATRAAQRKLKQLEIEKEQRIEEAEALKMTEEQRQILQNSFKSVKVEFSDLDGLSWSKVPQKKRVTYPNQTFVVLTNTDLASFGPHDTIRASASSRPRPRTSHSSPNFSSRPFLSSPSKSPNLRHARSTMSSRTTMKAILHNHRATRSRSPIKGLFPEDAYDSDSEQTICGSDSDLDDHLRHKKEREKFSIPKRTAALRGASSPSAVMVSARSIATKLAAAVSPKKSGVSSPAPQKADTKEPAFAKIPSLRSTAYPAYVTYSKSSPVKCSFSLQSDSQTPKTPLFHTISKSGSATTAVYHSPTSSGD
ncbi:hypothetical protein J132_00659 [Termitomyces sp. J132]|nr:hypothetical protein C0989_004231 [Termitomyces sp. Mn162]KAH0581666.1 hypothetical protein H2248_011362 [Termitomyces sp. 'cryptogamus']KNZ81420.1 hypothetical protein J132_00659 [Termitomyces sp. J132]